MGLQRGVYYVMGELIWDVLAVQSARSVHCHDTLCKSMMVMVVSATQFACIYISKSARCSK